MQIKHPTMHRSGFIATALATAEYFHAFAKDSRASCSAALPMTGKFAFSSAAA
jgi:hypothetical protein